MSDIISDQQKSKIYVRYKRLCEIYSKAEKRLTILEKEKDKISSEKYTLIKEDNENIVAETGPLIRELKPEMEAFIAKFEKGINFLKNEIMTNDRKFQESEELYKTGLIDKDVYKKDIKPLKNKRDRLKDELKKKENQLKFLKK